MAHARKRTWTRKDGTPVAAWEANWIGPGGEREWQSGFATKKAAEDHAHDQEGRIRRGLPTETDMTVREWLVDEWFPMLRDAVKAGEMAPRTAQGYESHVRLYLVPLLGRIELRKLKVGDVKRVLTHLQVDLGLSASSAKSVRATLMSALTAARRDELIERNVAEICAPPKQRKKRKSVFNREEFARILEEIGSDRLGAFFLFAALTGLRASELRALLWDHVNLQERWMDIHEGLHRVTKAAAPVVPEIGLVTSKTKTEDSEERVPLSNAAVALLLRHAEVQLLEQAMTSKPWPDKRYVFTTPKGTPLEPSNQQKAWRELLDRAHVPARTPDGRSRGLHELRRTFTTRLRGLGVLLEDVQALGRWSTPQVLLSYYSAHDEDRMRAAVDRLADDLLGEQ